MALSPQDIQGRVYNLFLFCTCSMSEKGNNILESRDNHASLPSPSKNFPSSLLSKRDKVILHQINQHLGATIYPTHSFGGFNISFAPVSEKSRTISFMRHTYSGQDDPKARYIDSICNPAIRSK